MNSTRRTPTPKVISRDDSAVGMPETPECHNAPSYDAPGREQYNISPVYPTDKRVGSPDSYLTGSPTLVRTMSGRTAMRSPVSPEEFIPMQSMFPQYNPNVPLRDQEYRPTRDVAAPSQLPMEKISRPPYSPPPEAKGPAGMQFITPVSEMYQLWNSANGQPNSPMGPQTFSMQMNRGKESGKAKSQAKERPMITFGSSPKRPFYSLRQSNMEPEIVSDPAGNQHVLEEHELLVFRHHPTQPDVLPIAHMDITPPPPPSLSTTHSLPVANSSGFAMDIEANAAATGHLPHHITTFAPALATLTSITAAANSPAGSAIALADPNANSPQARKMAEDAIRQAEEQESAELLWRRTSPSTGVYELLHPAMGVLHIQTEGHIFGRLDAPSNSKSRARISLLNPYPNSKDRKHEYLPPGPSYDDEDNSVLASLDMQAGILDVNATACQSLRNPYLIDVAVCTVFAVAVAESRRQEDPGLQFDAPPEPEIKGKGKGTTKPKPQPKGKKQQLQEPQQQTMEAEPEFEKLPKTTMGAFIVLKFIFKSAVWFVTLGFRFLGAILRGVARCFRLK